MISDFKYKRTSPFGRGHGSETPLRTPYSSIRYHALLRLPTIGWSLYTNLGLGDHLLHELQVMLLLLPLKSDERFSRIYTKKLGGVAAYYVDFYRCDSYLKAIINSSDTVSNDLRHSSQQ